MDWGNNLAKDKEAFARAVQNVKNDAYRIAFCYLSFTPEYSGVKISNA